MLFWGIIRGKGIEKRGDYLLYFKAEEKRVRKAGVAGGGGETLRRCLENRRRYKEKKGR